MEAYGRNFGDRRARHLLMTPRSRPADLGSIGRIDLLLGSPECTHHTCARGSRPRDERSKETAFYVTNFARRLNPRPRWVVLENVVQMRGWHGYDPLLAALKRLEYQTEVYTLDASWFGVPQTRRRVFIVGDREAKPPPQSVLPMVAGPARTASEVIDWTGRYASTPLFRAGRAKATIERFERGNSEMGPGKPFLLVYYGSDGGGGWQRVDRPLRTVTTIDRFALVTWQDGEPMMRMLQPDELAKAMGFDDGYSLDGIGQRRDRIRLLGNGVCPPVMTAIIQTLTARKSAAARSSERLMPIAAE